MADTIDIVDKSTEILPIKILYDKYEEIQKKENNIKVARH